MITPDRYEPSSPAGPSPLVQRWTEAHRRLAQEVELAVERVAHDADPVYLAIVYSARDDNWCILYLGRDQDTALFRARLGGGVAVKCPVIADYRGRGQS